VDVEAGFAEEVRHALLGLQNAATAGMTDEEYKMNKQRMSRDQQAAFYRVVEHVQNQR
jgi:hypothetical protein